MNSASTSGLSAEARRVPVIERRSGWTRRDTLSACRRPSDSHCCRSESLRLWWPWRTRCADCSQIRSAQTALPTSRPRASPRAGPPSKVGPRAFPFINCPPKVLALGRYGGLDVLIARDKANLDITWLRDDSLEDMDNPLHRR